jgi:excisionase family DNA binding protein
MVTYRPDGHQAYLRVAEVARRLGLPRSTVYHLVRTGRLPAVRLSPGVILVPEAELEACIRERRVGPVSGL